MKRSKYTEEQIAFALKQAKVGTAVEGICRKLSISDTTGRDGPATSGRSAAPGR